MSSTLLYSKDHSRTIIHIDIDCFYAQVEMIKDPRLRHKPLGVQQKNIVVTSNYIAREFGIKKCMLISEALKLCPNLTLVKGEDLYDYRQMSSKVTFSIHKFTTSVEKLGLDENFIDVSELVSSRIKTMAEDDIHPVGHIYGSTKEECECGCFQRINIGALIADEIRKTIKDDLGLTSCAGIAHNKLLAKLGGAVNKPDQQTLVYPSNASQLMSSLPDIKSIPGIGQSTYEIFKSINIKSVDELRNCPAEQLQEAFGAEKAKYYTDLSYGEDFSPVKQTGRPQSIGLEDSCRTVSIEEEVQEKFRQLLRRLMILVSEDGRIPRTLKVTLRKYDTQRKTSHREQRQCNISPTIFTVNNKIQLTQDAEDRIMVSVMNLFHKMIDISSPFHLTLFGLAFTKFQERQQGKHSIVSFLMKNVSVQAVTNFQNTKKSGLTALPMDYSPVGNKSSDFNTDGSESEVEPSPKKCKLGKLIAKRRCFDTSLECASPSKLRVAELRLNSREMDRPPIDNGSVHPDNVDPEIFKELPVDVQNELLQQWKIEKKATCSPISKPKTNTLLNYLIKNKQ